jgi:hypothetical protein
VSPNALHAQSFAYAPGTARYRMVVTSTGVSEAPGATKRDIDFEAEQRVAVTIIPRSRDTLSLEVVLDSARIHSSLLGNVDVAPAIGMKVTAAISPFGRLYSRELPTLTGREVFTQVAEEMARFLPIVPRALALGATWSDTTTEPVQQFGISATRTRITDYRVSAETTFSGERAWRIDRMARTMIDGSGTTMGTPLTLQSRSNGTGAYFVAPTGRYLGAALRDEVTAKVRLVGLDKDVVSTQTQSAEIVLVK